ncbi:hypothetical protein FSP39_003246 [Pinctada imbricata]|uniref:Uncharacterized protein n=1 Tax=Pinctada imbricata TaxID=66713 RepID=A0AA89C507_PINIB|nr:hypothetical protein FSP39_003246 [Pinctada imbricata]
MITVTYHTMAECPSNPQRSAFSCFTEYNTQLLNMQKSRGTLFSGVDVEILRAFCSSYNRAMNCIRRLKSNCPENEQRRIDVTLYNLEGARNELSELCGDDKIYEIYARHMTCFQSAGPYSEQCFEDIMNTTIRLMKRIDDKGLHQLCNDLHLTLRCIRSNIDLNCGKEAASLVNVLVKPMVRRSTKCDEYVKILPPLPSKNKGGDLQQHQAAAPTAPKHPMQKHRADKHRKRRKRDKERQSTHNTETSNTKTTHKPKRTMGNRSRLRTAICHGNSRKCGYPGLRAHNPLLFRLPRSIEECTIVV